MAVFAHTSATGIVFDCLEQTRLMIQQQQRHVIQPHERVAAIAW
jgi:hypothetical protein